MADFTIPAFIRGELITDNLVEFGGRGGDATFLAPDPMTIIDRLPLKNPGMMADLYELSLDEIIDFLAEVGKRLDLSSNTLLQEALEQSCLVSDMTRPLLESAYSGMQWYFEPDLVREVADFQIGIPYLEGWVERKLSTGLRMAQRAFGARALHIVAGNAPGISAMSIIRNAVTRSDAIIKLPSNDCLTSLVIARTMADVDPNHPVTKHLSVAYWRGGDTDFEERLYDPANIEKILAWGGFASVKHVTRYIQPGLELISLDPKRSATIIGKEVFESEESQAEAAVRLAADIGSLNQLGCLNARVIFAACGSDSAGIAKAIAFGEQVNKAIGELPQHISTPAKRFDPELRAEIDALKLNPDFFKVIGCKDNNGGIIVSLLSEPVDFYPKLGGRVGNIVPIDDELDAVAFMNSYTQTIGVYPESLKVKIRDTLALNSGQRIVSLGFASTGHPCMPQDGIEPVRRMVKWIVDEISDPAAVQAPWMHESSTEDGAAAMAEA